LEVVSIHDWAWTGDDGTTLDVDGIIFALNETFQAGCAAAGTPVLGDAQYTRNSVFDFDILNQKC
jgi:hypothetical protein